jgi:hypothetical protein
LDAVNHRNTGEERNKVPEYLSAGPKESGVQELSQGDFHNWELEKENGDTT